MAERVVDRLEAIEIDAEHRELAAIDAFERLDEMLPEKNAVRQIGQGIIMRHVGDLRLRLAARRYVLMRRQRAAAGKWLVQDRNGSAIARCPGFMPRLRHPRGR